MQVGLDNVVMMVCLGLIAFINGVHGLKTRIAFIDGVLGFKTRIAFIVWLVLSALMVHFSRVKLITLQSMFQITLNIGNTSNVEFVSLCSASSRVYCSSLLLIRVYIFTILSYQNETTLLKPLAHLFHPIKPYQRYIGFICKPIKLVCIPAVVLV